MTNIIFNDKLFNLLEIASTISNLNMLISILDNETSNMFDKDKINQINAYINTLKDEKNKRISSIAEFVISDDIIKEANEYNDTE